MKSKQPRKTVNPLHDYICQTVDGLVKPETFKQDKGSYSREYKLFQKLLKEYPDKRVWSNPNFQVNSLFFYFTEDGKAEIQKIQNKLDYTPKSNIVVELSEEKYGEDIKVDKLLSIKEFLKEYGK